MSEDPDFPLKDFKKSVEIVAKRWYERATKLYEIRKEWLKDSPPSESSDIIIHGVKINSISKDQSGDIRIRSIPVKKFFKKSKKKKI